LLDKKETAEVSTFLDFFESKEIRKDFLLH